MTWSTEAPRCSSGLSATNMRPELVVLPLPPVNAITDSTAGSAATVSTNSAIFRRMAGNEMSCAAWMLPAMRPTSCCGKKPLGTMTKR